MKIGFRGGLENVQPVRVGFIGCGSHSFRNIYPTFQFAPIELVATCDLKKEKAKAYAEAFGAKSYYTDHIEMLKSESLDAVFIVVGYDENGRPLYPQLAIDCLIAGCHVWIEKPPASSCAEIELMMDASKSTGKHVMVGLKKMFFPANRKASDLIEQGYIGIPQLAMLQYPQRIPTLLEFGQYLDGENNSTVVGFLDHLCHPVSLMIYLFGMPERMFYERAHSGAGSATFTYTEGLVVTLAFTNGSAGNGGMERTVIVGDSGSHIVVDNNIRVSLVRSPELQYGASPDYFQGSPDQATAIWEPEFSLGQLYNKGLFLLGYYGEVQEFADSILENRPPRNGTLEHAWMCTRVFEAFSAGPSTKISFI